MAASGFGRRRVSNHVFVGPGSKAAVRRPCGAVVVEVAGGRLGQRAGRQVEDVEVAPAATMSAAGIGESSRDPSTRGEGRHDEPDGLTPAQRQAQRRAWARLVRRVYELNPLVCEKCGGEMRIISAILDPAVITTILEHLRRKRDTATRAPPAPASSRGAAS